MLQMVTLCVRRPSLPPLTALGAFLDVGSGVPEAPLRY